MSAANEKIKPKTDIELFLNNANHCDWKNLKNDSGAGANAATGVDMTFSATDPLAEIVWSPDKGLSLKCADSSFADKNSSLFRDVGQSCHVVLAPPQSVICAKSDNAAATDAPTVHPISDSVVKPECKTYEEIDIGSSGDEENMNTAERAPNLPDDQDRDPTKDWENEKNTGDQANIGTDKISRIEGNKLSAISGQVDQRPFNNLLLQSDEPKPIMEQNPSPGRPSNKGIDIGIGKKAVVTDDDLHTVVEPKIEYKGSGASGTNLASSSRGPLEKLESSAENDLPTVDCEAACAATCGVIVNEIKNKSRDTEMMPLCDKVLPVLHSPCNSRIHMTKNKGKEESLSEGNANVRLSMDNDSHSSVESCNSAGFFSTGKKRCNFQQQLMIGSKRVKKNIEETSGSKSYIKQDSSFKNWISSMVKGLSQSIQANSNTLALTLANPDNHNVRSDEKFIPCKMNQNPVPKNTGFKSIFQSMYCPNLKNVGTRRMFHQEGEDNEDIEPSNMAQGIDATPITCCAENTSLSKPYLQSSKFEASTGIYDAGPSQPNIRPLNFFNSQESSKNYPVENENCSLLGLSKDKEEMASHSSSTRQNTNNTENVDSSAPSERKEAENICHRRDTLGRSLWMTRFSPKSTAPLIISDHLDERDGIARPQTDEADQILSGGTIRDGTDHQADQSIINLKRKSNDIITFKISECNPPFKIYHGSSSKENKVKENPIISPSRLAERRISPVPEGIFDAVKKLQLSRTDILKWINAHGSISQLDGFFLRLRLGKWEEGLGGTGYHVACINETERQSSEQNTRKSLPVKVGGIKCMVESQYISNQDFLEEEIMEWWSSTSEAGVEIPSEEYLIAKFKKKQLLGL